MNATTQLPCPRGCHPATAPKPNPKFCPECGNTGWVRPEAKASPDVERTVEIRTVPATYEHCGHSPQPTPPLADPAGSEPLPCPFCGGLSAVSESANLWRVGCPECCIETNGFFDREDAVVAWNQRSEWDHKTVGAGMRAARERIGISGREMAKRMKCSASYVSDLEQGRRCWTPAKLQRYRAALSPNTELTDRSPGSVQ